MRNARCSTGIYIRSHEHDDAIAEVAASAATGSWSLATWDVDRGLALAGRPDGPGGPPGGADPLAAVRSRGQPRMATPVGHQAILKFRNFHRFLGLRR